MKALIVSVNYAPELAVTLPRNARHFDDILVVTDTHDLDTPAVVTPVRNADLFCTEAFHREPGMFRKDAAIVEGLKYLDPQGWVMLLDADILLPENMFLPPPLEIGNLYAPYRRMCPDLAPEADWKRYPLQKDIVFAGYCQLFHRDDPNLQPWPNYPVEPLPWYSDTTFQDRWRPEKKVRLPFEVLHIGDPPRLNWCGRSPEGRETLRRLLKNPQNVQWRSKWTHQMIY